VVFSSQELPLVITYNFETKCHIFHGVEIDIESIETSNEKLNFEGLIQTLDTRESNFTEKTLKGFSDVSLREIFRDSLAEGPASEIKITASIYNSSTGGHKHQIFVYMVIGKELEKSLRIFSLTYILHEKGQKLFYSESAKRLRVIEGVAKIKRVNFLTQTHDFSFFKSKDYFSTKKKSKSLSMNTERTQSIMDPSKLEKRFLAYMGKKMTTHLFKSSIMKDAVVVFRPGSGLWLMVEEFILIEIPLLEINPFLTKTHFELKRIKLVDNVIELDAVVQGNSRVRSFWRIPTFKDEFSLTLIGILKEVFDRHMFWGVMADLITFCGSEFSHKISESELIISYFACLLCQDNLKQSTEIFEEFLTEHSQHQNKQIHVSPKLNSEANQDLDLLMNEYSSNKTFRFIRDKTLLIKSSIPSEITPGTTKDQKQPKVRSSDHNVRNFRKSLSSDSISKDPKTILRQLLPRISINIRDFCLSKVKLLKYLHLLNEDMRLCKTRKNINLKLTYFLYVYTHFLGVNHSRLYSQYYLKICPEILISLRNYDLITKLMCLAIPEKQDSTDELQITDQNMNVYFNEHLNKEVFDVISLMSEVFACTNSSHLFESRISRLPIYFQNTYNVMKVISLITGSNFKGKKYQRVVALEEPKVIAMYSNAQLLPFLPRFFEKCDKDLFRQRLLSRASGAGRNSEPASHKLYDKIFFFMIKNNISLIYIESLADACEYFYKSVLRILRKEVSNFLTHVYLPRSAYQLLQREDLHANQLMSPFVRSSMKINLNRSGAMSQTMNFPVSAISASHPVIQTPNATYLPSSLFIHANDDARARNETSLLFTPLQKAPSMINAPFKTAQQIVASQALNNTDHHPYEQIIQLEHQLSSSAHSSFNRNLHYSKNDALFRELYRLYNCSDIIALSSKTLETLLNNERVEEERIAVELQMVLYGPLCERLSGFIGRGALELNTEQLGLTDLINIPNVSTTGKLKGNDLKYSYNFNPDQKDDRSAMNWCDFHNGVASALSISRRQLAALDKDSMRTWIEYQRTENQRYDHAGLLFGLGIQGFFNCYTMSDVYFNLKAGNDARIIGTLLGLAASKLPNQRAAMEETILKAINLHLEFNFMTNQEIQLSRMIQSAAMIAMGMYHKGLCKKSLSEMMLVQIEAKPFNESNNDREGHSLAAGFSLGFINLGKGSNVPSIKDIKIDEKLFNLIKDGSKGSRYFNNEASGNTSSGNNFGDFNKKRSGYKASNVREPAEGNLLMTTPSALMALTLIHLKTNNSSVALRIEVPKTIYEIINGNPLTVFQRVLAKHLIMWDSIQISQEFITSAIPELVRFLQENPLSVIAEQFVLNSNFDDIDYHNLSLIYYNSIVGTLLAMSLKYTGTGDETLKSIIVSYIRQVESLKIIENEFCLSQNNKNRIDLHSYYSLLSSMCISLGILMAGKCDVESLKVVRTIVRKLRWQTKLPDSELNESVYGFHMALQMAIGFLFLGNGSLTFGNGDFQIGCLLMSIYPVFPSHFSDNRHHLQVLRHYYVLATEEK
jgi:hypothetical protein